MIRAARKERALKELVRETHGIVVPKRNTRIRRLALAKVRELRLQGLSFWTIGRLYGPLRAGAEPDRCPSASRRDLEGASLPSGSGNGSGDGAEFLRALDALHQGVAFYSCTATLLHRNRTLEHVLHTLPEGAHIVEEIELFARTLCGLAHVRGLRGETTVHGGLATQTVPVQMKEYRLRGSYIGFDLFGAGESVLIELERPALDPLSEKALRAHFRLTRQESRVARLLVEGRGNAEIARALGISPHTARHHTQGVLRKLGVSSRAEVAGRILLGGR